MQKELLAEKPGNFFFLSIKNSSLCKWMQLCAHTHCFSTAVSAAWHHIFIFPPGCYFLYSTQSIAFIWKVLFCFFVSATSLCRSRLHDVKQCSISSLGYFYSHASWAGNTIEDETTDHCKRNALLHSISKYHSKPHYSIQEIADPLYKLWHRKRPYSKPEDMRLVQTHRCEGALRWSETAKPGKKVHLRDFMFFTLCLISIRAHNSHPGEKNRDSILCWTVLLHYAGKYKTSSVTLQRSQKPHKSAKAELAHPTSTTGLKSHTRHWANHEHMAPHICLTNCVGLSPEQQGSRRYWNSEKR